jgi:iron complex outermembrane recepter protein
VFYPVPIRRGMELVNISTKPRDTTTVQSTSGTLNWDLSDHLSLVSITDYTHFSENGGIDVGGTPASSTVGPGDSLPGNPYPYQTIMRSYLEDHFNYHSQELRFNYKGGSANAIFGGYYQRVQDDSSLDAPANVAGSVVGGAARGYDPTGRYFSGSPTYVSITNRTASLFGDLTYAIMKQFKAFAGLRYTNEAVRADYLRNDFASPLDLYSLYDAKTGSYSGPTTRTVATDSAHSDNNLSGRAGLQFLPTDNINVYASYARGYKGPAVNTGATLSPGTDPIIKPETARAYELGSKLRLFDNRLALNMATFYEVISGIQEGVLAPNTNVVTVQLINAGNLYTRGFEGDAHLAITPKLRINVAVDYDRATYGSFSVPCTLTQNATHTCPNAPLAGTQNIKGQQAIGSPEWKYSSGGEYESDLGKSGLSYFGSVNYTWAGSIGYILGNDPLNREPSHGSLSANIGLRGDRWEVQVFGKNLTNEFYYTYVRTVAVAGQLSSVGRDFERYGGIRVTARF